MEAASNDLFEQWKKGTTGHALVDRYMLQLDETGFIPHDARLLVATFLIYSLKIDWTLGAAYFEEKLIDYASASNWGNWAIVAHSAESKQRKSAFDLDKYLRILDSETAVSKSLA
jgi:deoxyribodipyrimidine photo-lyase